MESCILLELSLGGGLWPCLSRGVGHNDLEAPSNLSPSVTPWFCYSEIAPLPAGDRVPQCIIAEDVEAVQSRVAARPSVQTAVSAATSVCCLCHLLYEMFSWFCDLSFLSVAFLSIAGVGPSEIPSSLNHCMSPIAGLTADCIFYSH